jgi:hypothetical protein
MQFKDYFFSKINNELALPSPQKAELAVSTAIDLEISPLELIVNQKFSTSQKKDFSKKVSKYVYSEGFIQEFSDDIGKPQPNESENQFVERAKSSIRKLLTEKMEG